MKISGLACISAATAGTRGTLAVSIEDVSELDGLSETVCRYQTQISLQEHGLQNGTYRIPFTFNCEVELDPSRDYAISAVCLFHSDDTLQKGDCGTIEHYPLMLELEANYTLELIIL